MAQKLWSKLKFLSTDDDDNETGAMTIVLRTIMLQRINNQFLT